jgi:putative endonuclease
MPRSPSGAINSRQRAERRGQTGEALAALYLRLKLYRVLARRAKTPLGEIDLVARKGDTLVFVEVKTRARVADETEAHAAVNRRRISRAASWYLSRDRRLDGLTVRFDLIFFGRLSWPHHIPNAFEGTP